MREAKQHKLTVTVEIPDALLKALRGDNTLLKALLRGQQRIEAEMDTLDQALELLTTAVGDLDDSIQEEIAELEALRQQQGGKLTDAQKARLTVLLDTIHQQKEALDADNTAGA
jgi:septal ring factor EnvC (AmiA/AmiB activator)